MIGLSKLALGALSLALGASFFVSAAWLETHIPSLCLWHALFGQSCPTCGLTRSLCAISHGQWQAAWAYHKLSFLIYTLLWSALIIGVKKIIDQKSASSPS